MLNKFFFILAAALISSAAFSGDAPINPSLKADLGKVVESGTVEPVNGITAAGQPDAAALKVFADSGYTTVIDLRGENENRGFDEPAAVEELGMQYVPFPITGLDAISFENARKLDHLIESADGPVLVHCGSSNRVGALLALSKKLEGADAETAMSYGLEGGLTSLAGTVQEVLSRD